MANPAGGYGGEVRLTRRGRIAIRNRVNLPRPRRAETRITPTVAMDALTAEHYPLLVRHSSALRVIAHGIQ